MPRAERSLRQPFPVAFFIMGSLIIALLAIPAILARTVPSPVYYKNIPFPAENVSLSHPPIVVPIQVERCNTTDAALDYEFTRTVVNDGTGTVVILANGKANIPPGCQKVRSQLQGIPADLTPGRYHIDGTTTVKGQWATYTVPWHTQTFDVAR